MKYYNITFSIAKPEHLAGVEYLKNIFIPRLIKGGILGTPSVLRVAEPVGHESDHYAIRFPYADDEAVKEWVECEVAGAMEDIYTIFGDNILPFATYLEDANW
jgi:hypothetical protein